MGRAHPTPKTRRAEPTSESLATDLGFEAATRLATDVRSRVEGVLRGKPEPVTLALVALLSGGHLLVEDVPGVGKTLLAKALARAAGGVFHRVQCTPDLLPSELTGVSVFHLAGNEWEFRPGPLFAHVVLVDELNRATPRTQSALLEAMEERHVTVDGVTRDLPHPFFLVATQNPFETIGTFPLVEGQLDRFAVVAHIGAPDAATERARCCSARVARTRWPTSHPCPIRSRSPTRSRRSARSTAHRRSPTTSSPSRPRRAPAPRSRSERARAPASRSSTRRRLMHSSPAAATSCPTT